MRLSVFEVSRNLHNDLRLLALSFLYKCLNLGLYNYNHLSNQALLKKQVGWLGSSEVIMYAVTHHMSTS